MAHVVGGVTITHPDRVISETGNITKGALAEYYAAVAALMLPHIVRRPLSLLRCPTGIDEQLFLSAESRPRAGTRCKAI